MINIVFEVLLALAFSAGGYFAVSKYLELGNKPQKLNIMTLTAELIISVLMIILLNVLYKADFIVILRALSLALILCPVGFIDFKKLIIPNALLIAGLIIRVVFFAVSFFLSKEDVLTELKDCGLGALIFGGAFLIMHLIFKNSVGAGDVKLFFLIGLYEGLEGTFSALFFSLIVSFVVSVFLLITKKKNKKDVIPFGPCVLIGTVVSILMTGM